MSPLLGNVYLHYALDIWFERKVKPGLAGKAILVRYCDDFVMGFQNRLDAEQVHKALAERMAHFGLTLHPEKTRLLPFRRPPDGQSGGKGPSTFDFLGFTLYWRQSRSGRWHVVCRTRGARLRRAIRSVAEWCRDHRHLSVEEQHQSLTRRIRGHFNYYGVNGNSASLGILVHWVRYYWHKWLRRRGQRSRLTWERFKALLQDYPLPMPRVVVRIWG